MMASVGRIKKRPELACQYHFAGFASTFPPLDVQTQEGEGDRCKSPKFLEMTVVLRRCYSRVGQLYGVMTRLFGKKQTRTPAKIVNQSSFLPLIPYMLLILSSCGDYSTKKTII